MTLTITDKAKGNAKRYVELCYPDLLKKASLLYRLFLFVRIYNLAYDFILVVFLFFLISLLYLILLYCVHVSYILCSVSDHPGPSA